MTNENQRQAAVFTVPVPRSLILATSPRFRRPENVGAEIGLLVFGMTARTNRVPQVKKARASARLGYLRL
jgi:hypothetical protein